MEPILQDLCSAEDLSVCPTKLDLLILQLLMCLSAGSRAGWLLALEPPPAAAFNPFLAPQRGPAESALGKGHTHHLHNLPYFPSHLSISDPEENGQSAGSPLPPPGL